MLNMIADTELTHVTDVCVSVQRRWEGPGGTAVLGH